MRILRFQSQFFDKNFEKSEFLNFCEKTLFTHFLLLYHTWEKTYKKIFVQKMYWEQKIKIKKSRILWKER